MARRAKCLTQLVKEVDAAWPGRDKGSGSSDGWLGDQAHQARKSDHNPNEVGVVRAQDIDVDLDGRGVITDDDEALVQYLVGLGRNGDNRLNPDGYVISCRRIWSSAHNWVERVYTGSNAHEKHTHVSCSSRPSGYDDDRDWGIAKLVIAPPPIPQPDPPQPQEDTDVPWIANPVTDNDPGQYFVNGDTYVPIASIDELNQLKNSGFHVHDLEPHSWALFKATATERPHP